LLLDVQRAPQALADKKDVGVGDPVDGERERELAVGPLLPARRELAHDAVVEGLFPDELLLRRGDQQRGKKEDGEAGPHFFRGLRFLRKSSICAFQIVSPVAPVV
jgi:hypothetical protein